MMRRLITAAMVGAIALAPTGFATLSAQAPAEAPLISGRLQAPEKVADGVWVMRQPDRLWAAVIGNVTIIEQADGVLLFDSGGTIADGREVVAAVRRLTPKPIKAVVISHWHNDHPLGVGGIREAFPAIRVIATASAAEALKTRPNVGVGQVDVALQDERLKNNTASAQLFEDAAKDATLSADMRAGYAIEAPWVRERTQRQIGNYVVLPTETFTDRLLLPDAERPMEVVHLGAGNTEGDAVAWLPRQKVVATGDLVVLPTPYGFSISTQPWLATLDRLEALDFAALVPGHGKVQRDRAYLATLRWSMSDIAARAKALAATDATAEQAWERFDRTEHERRFAVTGDWDRYWLERYWLKGMFETAFKEARGTPAQPG